MLFLEISRQRSRATQNALPGHMRDVSLRTYINYLLCIALELYSNVLLFSKKIHIYVFCKKKYAANKVHAVAIKDQVFRRPIYEIQCT